jgi:hypothetical protein
MKTMRDSIYTEVLPFMGKVRGTRIFNDSIKVMIKNNPVLD